MEVKHHLWMTIATATLCCLLGCQAQSESTTAETRHTQNDDHPVSPTDLDLDYESFDQRPGNGWRKLVDAGKHLEAAKLIDTYVAHQSGLEGWQVVNLRFHAGQLYAFLDKERLALARFKSSINPNEPNNSPIRWNAYVRATIAFLEKDRETLIRMRTEIASGPEWQGTVPNLDVVDRLLANFDDSYAIAYGTDKDMAAE
jgi:hypothetical protein